MKLIDVFHTNEPVIDQWTFVFDERDPLTGYLAMLATDDNGRMFSQWTEGFYDQGGDNTHLGERPRYIGEVLVGHVLARMSEGDAFESPTAFKDHLSRMDMPQDELD